MFAGWNIGHKTDERYAHEKNSGDTVRRLSNIIQNICCVQSGASIRLSVWKWSDKSRYPGTLTPVLENFRRTFSPDPGWLPSEDAPCLMPVCFGTAVSIKTIGLSINECSHLKGTVWREKKMSSSEVRAAGECKNLTLFNLYYLCRASFSPPHSRRERGYVCRVKHWSQNRWVR